MRTTNTIIACFILLLGSCRTDKRAVLPEFSILLSDSVTTFNTASIPSGNPIILIQFSADCKECQEETEQILANMNSFDNARFYFITYEKFDRLRVFNKHYKLQNYNNIVAGQDYEAFMAKHFNTRTTPFLAIYDDERKLKAVFEGKAEIDKLINVVKETNK